MSIVGTWVFNDVISIDSGTTFNVDFTITVDGVTYNETAIKYTSIVSGNYTYVDYNGGTNVSAFTMLSNGAVSNTWNNEQYKTIVILNEPTDETFITWLQANATKQETKVLKRLYLGDVVKSFGTKQLRKLTTVKPEEPAESIVGTWVFNDTVNLSPVDVSYSISGSLQTGYNFDAIKIKLFLSSNDGNAYWYLTYNLVDVGDVGVYSDEEGWGNVNDKTITITGGADITNETLITWLKANATKQ